MLKKLAALLYRALPGSLLNRLANFFQPHFTVTVAAIALDETDRLLLLKHTFRGGSGWGIPGGFLAKGEQPEEGLRRELLEEIGLKIKDERLALARTVETARQIQIVYLCRPAGEPAAKSIEIEKYDWFALNALPEQLSRSQRAIIDQALAKTRERS